MINKYLDELVLDIPLSGCEIAWNDEEPSLELILKGLETRGFNCIHIKTINGLAYYSVKPSIDN